VAEQGASRPARTWKDAHAESEELAAHAELALRSQHHIRAKTLYRKAALAEEGAYYLLVGSKRITRGITAVSATALWYKSGDYVETNRVAEHFLEQNLPDFAQAQLRNLLLLSEAGGLKL